MPELPRKVLLEAGLLLRHDTAKEANPRRYVRDQVWRPRMYAQRAHDKDFMRHQVFTRDKTVCSNCGLNCSHLYQALDFVQMAIDHHHLGFDFHFSDFKRAVGFARVWRFPKALWDAHMIVPKSAGGNDHDLGNFLTLCLACHRRETNRTFYSPREGKRGLRGGVSR